MNQTREASTATPPRPDLSMVFAIHAALTRDAALLVDAVSGLLPEDRAHRIPAIARYHEAFARQLTNHHGHEDEVFFPALVAKVGPEAMGLDALERQHHGLDEAIVQLSNSLHNVGDTRTGFSEAKTCAAQAAEALQARLLEHLATEEGTAFPVYVESLTVSEHLALEQQVQEMGTFEDLCFMIPWLFDAIPPEPRKQILDRLPEFLQSVYVDHRLSFRALASCLHASR